MRTIELIFNALDTVNLEHHYDGADEYVANGGKDTGTYLYEVVYSRISKLLSKRIMNDYSHTCDNLIWQKVVNDNN